MISIPECKTEIGIFAWDTMEGNLVEDSTCQGIPRVSLPIILIEMYNLTVQALVDTGASLSVIAQDLFVKLADQNIKIIPVSQMKIRGIIPDRSLKAKVQIFAEFQIEGRGFGHQFLVLPMKTFSVILGMDFIAKYGVVVDTPKNIISIGNEAIKLVADDALEHEFARMINEVSPMEMLEKKANENKLPETQKREFLFLIEGFSEIFNNTPGEIPNFEYSIYVNDWTPFKGKPYGIPLKFEEEVSLIIQDMVECGIISKCPTPFLNPLAIVRKPDGKLRVCLDARKLNTRIVPEYDQPPSIQDAIRTVKDRCYISTIDLTASYYHVRLDKRSRLLTGFMFKNITYVFERLPFGLKNSGAALIRILDSKLSQEVKEITIRYVDDILVASYSYEEHYNSLKLIFADLKRIGLRINIRKSVFFQQEVLFLGFVIDKDGVKPNPHKIQKIINFPKPTSIKQVRQFLGTCQFFAAHCPRYAQIVSPLYDLLQRGNRWKWREAHSTAFEEVKAYMQRAIKLSHPNFEYEMIIQTDASYVGIANILFQEIGPDKEKRIIQFASRKLRRHECHYTVTEVEALAVVYALQQHRKLIFGRKIVVRTDHRALTFILNTQIANERIMRWALFIQIFDIQLEHCEGRNNQFADFLSRNPEDQAQSTTPMMVIRPEEIDEEVMRRLRYLRQSQRREPILRGTIRYLQGTIPVNDPEYATLREDRPTSYC